MMDWWRDLSRREQTLLMTAGALFLVLFVSLAVVRPIAQWRGDAAQRAERSRDGYELVASAAAVGAGEASPAARASTPLRQAITASASAARIDLVRIGAEANGQIEVQPQPVDGEQLFQWLAALESRYGVTVAFADMSRDDGGVVNAQVLVLERN